MTKVICPTCGRGLSAKYREPRVTHPRYVAPVARREMSRSDLAAARSVTCSFVPTPKARRRK